MTSETKHFINKREKLYNICRRTERILNHDNYKKIRNQVSAMIRRNKIVDSKKKITSFGTNKKAFYRNVNSKQQVRHKIQQLKKDGGGQTENDEQAATELSELFRSVFVTETRGAIPEMKEDVMNRPTAIIDHLEISVDDVRKRMKAIKADKSPGPDAINPAFLKKLAECLAAPMTKICKKSLQERRLPHDWKTANVSPVFMKGSRSEPRNYRPVSLTSIPCKVLDSITRDKMLKYA